ncbi:MAG: SRPBCC family protein [Caulobacteraceae bacterium]
MRRHALTKVLPYAPDQLFALVADVDRYPEFVPWLTAMRTWNAHEIEPGVNVVDAEAGVGFSFLRETFATRVIRDANERHVGVNLIRGPFRALKNDWRFEPEGEGTTIAFSIEFEFKSRLLDAFLAANMDRAIDRLIACFEARAKVLYGAQTAQNA